MKKYSFVLLLFLLVTLALGGCCQGVNTKTKKAPAGPAAARDEWGRKNFKKYYTAAVDWIKASPAIQKDVGTITEIAPSGGPNCLQDFFTDGRMATLTIEVIGDKGRGIVSTGSFSLSHGIRGAQWLVLKKGEATRYSTDDITQAGNSAEKDRIVEQMMEQDKRVTDLDAKGEAIKSK